MSVRVPDLPPKAMAALAFFWVLSECTSEKGRKKTAGVRDNVLKAAFRAGSANPQTRAMLLEVADFLEEADVAAAEMVMGVKLRA